MRRYRRRTGRGARRGELARCRLTTSSEILNQALTSAAASASYQETTELWHREPKDELCTGESPRGGRGARVGGDHLRDGRAGEGQAVRPDPGARVCEGRR